MTTPIQLEKPIPRGEGQIDTITLRKHDAGALRGLVLSDLLRMEAGAVADLLPRITEPPLLAHEVARMDAADLMSCAVEISNFLLPRSLKPARWLPACVPRSNCWPPTCARPACGAWAWATSNWPR